MVVAVRCNTDASSSKVLSQQILYRKTDTDKNGESLNSQSQRHSSNDRPVFFWSGRVLFSFSLSFHRRFFSKLVLFCNRPFFALLLFACSH
jgi:hypothetical protein